MDYQSIIKNIDEKGIEEGLTKKDYYIISNHITLLRDIIYSHSVSEKSLEKYRNYKNHLEGIIIELENNGLLKKVNQKNIDYIMNHSDLLPLVLCNQIDSRIILYGTISFRFLCQFHKEKTPSMGVTDLKNLYYCFGCGSSGNVYDYLKNCENTTFMESVYLASAIYGIEMPKNNYIIDDNSVEKYRETITSESYKSLLVKSYNRLKSRNENSLWDKNQIRKTSDIFEEKFNQIERIKLGEKDREFIFHKPDERVFLERDCNEPTKKLILTNKNHDLYDELPFN